MRYDAVWTVDHHPSLCGTVKFSHQLAARLGVPVVTFTSAAEAVCPLLSFRASEIKNWRTAPQVPYGLFLHDWEPLDEVIGIEAVYREQWVRDAVEVFAANHTIVDQIRPLRSDVVTLFAPSTIQGNPTRPGYRVLTFGMAHKLKVEHYQRLKVQLDLEHGDDYSVSVSTAVHEGSPWDATAHVADELRAIFGDRLRVLGYLADDALARELQECDLVALFYEPALRVNNTTYWAAKAAGKPVITNRDEHSPKEGDEALYTWARLLDVLHAEVPCEA